MIITVLSDTHLEYPDGVIASVYDRYCLDADMVLHCGDMVGEETWAFFNAHPRFFAVQGNCDLPPLRGALPALRELDVEGVRIGMAHGWGPRSQVGNAVAAQFSGVDIVCYGHTHIRDWRILPDGTRLLNPGSLLWPRSGEGGLARLHLKAGRAPEVEWISL